MLKHKDREVTRLSMFIPKQLHRELSIISKIRGCTMTDYVMRVLVKALTQEKKYIEIKPKE